jgi:hypothetical protein
MRTLPNVEVVWKQDEQAPIFGENASNIPDNVYMDCMSAYGVEPQDILADNMHVGRS